MKKLLFSLIIYFLPVCTLFAYTEKNLLQRKTSEERLKELLVLHQQWVAYPDYTDRQGWDALFGEFKDVYIRRGEKALEYRWQVIQAMDYIEYERSGSRKIMENPYNENAQTLTDLFLAELAEGKGRFIEPLANGVFYFCEMTSWALSAHVRLQHDNRKLPDANEKVLALPVPQLDCAIIHVQVASPDGTCSIEGDEFSISSDQATSVALVVNEIVQNATEHAFITRDSGKVEIKILKGEKFSKIKISDNGVGMEVNKETDSMGLLIISSLVKDKLKGNLEIRSKKDKGTTIEFDFKN